MIVCSCEAVSDREIRDAISRGNTRLPELKRATGAGRCCGACACDLKAMLREHAHGAVPARLAAK